MYTTSSSERRKCVRLKGHKRAILIQPNGMHHIRDISFAGLSFRCPRDEVFSGQWPIEIIVAGSLLDVIGVSVRLVREKVDNGICTVFPPSKEIGVEYLDLDENSRTLMARLLSYLRQTARK